MKSRTILNSSVVLTLMATLLIAAAAPAQTTTDLDYRWTAPSTGSAVDHYVVQHSVDGTNWTTVATVTSAEYTLAATFGEPHQLRVAGVDADDRQGPWSDPSDPYTPDAGAPGQPGKPIIF